MDKYFVPDIEDIRVGYECEMKIAEQEDIWVKTVFAIPDITSICNRDGDKFSLPVDIIRVPYLTKEQIEAEGWKFIEYEPNAMIFDRTYLKLRYIPFIPTEAEGERGTFLVIWNKKGWNIYLGECKDINTFRYICKLLKICV